MRLAHITSRLAHIKQDLTIYCEASKWNLACHRFLPKSKKICCHKYCRLQGQVKAFMLIGQNIFFGSKILACVPLVFYADPTGISFFFKATWACVQLVQCGMPSKMPAENGDCKKNWGFSLRLLPPPGRKKRSNQKYQKNKKKMQ